MQILHPFQMTLRRVANLHFHTVNLWGLVFFFWRFSMVHSDKERATERSIGQKKKNATMQRHSKEECKLCILHQGQPAMLHSSSENFRHIANDFDI